MRKLRLATQPDIAFPRAAIWPVLSKTDWLNRSLGLLPVCYDFAPRAKGGSVTWARARILGLEMRWREVPFEWRAPEFYRVHRVFESGPFTEAWMGMDLHEQPGGGTRVAACFKLGNPLSELPVFAPVAGQYTAPTQALLSLRGVPHPIRWRVRQVR